MTAGALLIGTGHWINHSKEHCLIGIKGQPKLNANIDCDVCRLSRPELSPALALSLRHLAPWPATFPNTNPRSLGQVICSEVRETSRKPDEMCAEITVDIASRRG